MRITNGSKDRDNGMGSLAPGNGREDMKTTRRILMAVAALLIFACGNGLGANDVKKGEKNPFEGVEAVSLFDGKTFAGWEGDMSLFRVEDGAIVAGNLKADIPRNEFLCTTTEYSDFELTLKVKIIGAKANAGIQIRSRRIPNNNEVKGYQADVGEGYWGGLYDEARRHMMLVTPEKTIIEKAVKPNEWNDYRIRCVGKRIQLWLNGAQTVDYTETNDQIEQKGIIGVQIHGGPPSEAWYKDIAIKELKT